MGKGRAAAYRGSIDPLVAAVSPHVTTSSFFKYREKRKGKIDPKILITQRGWLRPLEDVWPQMMFSAATMNSVAEAIFDEKNNTNGGSWVRKVKDNLREQWCTTMGERMRWAANDFGKARNRKQQPRWLASMEVSTEESVPLGEADVFDEEEESGSEEKTEEVEVPKIQVEPQALNYHYGFDEDRKLAWRAPFDNPNKRQYHHGEPEKGNGDHIAVRFKNDDGTEDLHQLEDVSVQDWEEIKAASAMLGKASKSVEPLFWRCFKDNTAAAEIKRVNDKKQGSFFVLFKVENHEAPRKADRASTQKLRIKIDSFLEAMPEDEAEPNALNIMKSIATVWADGALEDEQLIEKRNELMNGKGVKVPQPPITTKIRKTPETPAAAPGAKWFKISKNTNEDGKPDSIEPPASDATTPDYKTDDVELPTKGDDDGDDGTGGQMRTDFEVRADGGPPGNSLEDAIAFLASR